MQNLKDQLTLKMSLKKFGFGWNCLVAVYVVVPELTGPTGPLERVLVLLFVLVLTSTFSSLESSKLSSKLSSAFTWLNILEFFMNFSFADFWKIILLHI